MKVIEVNALTGEALERDMTQKEQVKFETGTVTEVPYEQKVIDIIREKYTVDEELAIQRQRETKPNEFNVYFNYCEECKRKAKQ